MKFLYISMAEIAFIVRYIPAKYKIFKRDEG